MARNVINSHGITLDGGTVAPVVPQNQIQEGIVVGNAGDVLFAENWLAGTRITLAGHGR